MVFKNWSKQSSQLSVNVGMSVSHLAHMSFNFGRGQRNQVKIKWFREANIFSKGSDVGTMLWGNFALVAWCSCINLKKKIWWECMCYLLHIGSLLVWANLFTHICQYTQIFQTQYSVTVHVLNSPRGSEKYPPQIARIAVMTPITTSLLWHFVQGFWIFLSGVSLTQKIM